MILFLIVSHHLKHHPTYLGNVKLLLSYVHKSSFDKCKNNLLGKFILSDIYQTPCYTLGHWLSQNIMRCCKEIATLFYSNCINCNNVLFSHVTIHIFGNKSIPEIHDLTLDNVMKCTLLSLSLSPLISSLFILSYLLTFSPLFYGNLINNNVLLSQDRIFYGNWINNNDNILLYGN